MAAGTVGYVHRILHRAFGHATTWGLIATNPAAAAEPPRAKRQEVEILSEAQVKVVLSTGLRGITLHAWRHTHASQLIASGMDVLSISRRLGHGSPSITLDVYGHLFHASDDRAALVFEKAFGAVVTE